MAFSSKWHHSDVVLVVEGRRFHTHKCILSMNSRVFERMFSPDSHFKEKSAAEIPLPGKSAKEFEVLLKLLYSDEKPSLIDYNNFEFLMKLADEYQMGKIKKLCADFMKSNIDQGSCLHFCLVANEFDLSEDMGSEQQQEELEVKSEPVDDVYCEPMFGNLFKPGTEIERKECKIHRVAVKAVKQQKYKNDIIEKCVNEAKWLPLSSIEGSKYFAQIKTTSSKLAKQILCEKIKVLEEYKCVLDEYHSTCRGLVSSIYESAAAKQSNSLDCPWVCYTSYHAARDTRDKFVFDCTSCVHKLEMDWPCSAFFKKVKFNAKDLRFLADKYDGISRVNKFG